MICRWLGGRFFFPVYTEWMPRNSASGANRQRRRPQNGNTDNDRRRRFKGQSGHPDPNIRLDGQSKEQSFVHLETTGEPISVEECQGGKWKIKKDCQNKKKLLKMKYRN